MSSRSIDSFSQVVLGLVISGTSLTAALLILYGYAAWNPVSRRYLDRVSFRLLVYALLAHLVFGIVMVVDMLAPNPTRRCELLAFLINLSLMFSAGMFFCIAINLPLVLTYNVNGQKMEKYYVLGIGLVCLICNVTPYAAGKLGWAVDGTCWYRGTNPREVLRWLIGTQTVWILLASVGEVGAFLIILGYLIVYEVRSCPSLLDGETLGLIMTHWKLDARRFLADTQLGASYTLEASRRTGSTIQMFRNIILRIGLYPLVACLVNISTSVLDLQSQQNKLSIPLSLTGLTIYALRPLIYVLLAATDPSFIRALQALRHPESDFETGPHHHVSRSTQRTMPTGRLSTVIIEMSPDEVECEPGWSRKEAAREQSQTATGTSTSGAEEWHTGTDRGQIGIATNPAPNQRASVIDVVYHI
ncbi:hypothetical protein C8R44DRAFT_981985 [Mycena epipterygia]|nr:hypothetical protein C8R44DRAFT_981985 [Mycena epipterygia]